MIRLPARALSAAALLAAAPPAFAADGPAVRPTAAQLAALRAEVESLSARVREAREEARAEGRALQAQALEIEAQLRQERIRQKTLMRLREAERQEANHARQQADALRAPVEAALAQVQAYIEASLPLRREERRAAVADLRRRLDDGSLDPASAFGRLWRLLEDELTLTGELGIHDQVVEIDGRPRLAEVLHVGLGLLYVRTAQGEVGWLHQDLFQRAHDPAWAQAIDDLFERVRAHRRTGPAPLVLPAGSVRTAQEVRP